MENHLSISQYEDTYPKNVNLNNYAFRYAYIRSSDSRNYDDPGQDYLSFSSDDNTFIFVICDGVSQSFFGDLGAKLLGNGLIEWLQSMNNEFESGKLQASLSNYLVKFTATSKEYIDHYPLPENVSPILHDVLEKKRGHGSESTFVCGRIDFPSESFADGRIFLGWMGDTRLRIWRDSVECTNELEGDFDTKKRWSSNKGLVGGDPYVFISDLGNMDRRNHITKILAYSDGLSSLDHFYEYITNKRLLDLLVESMESPTSDDISYIEIFLNVTDQNKNMYEKNEDTKNLRTASIDVPTQPRK